MAVLPIRLFGDPVLTTPAEPVTTFDAELRRLVRNLDQTLYDQRGSGLAAPQVGVGLRVFVFHDEDVAGHLVNPVLDFPDEQEQDGPEGCLSIPGLYFDTKRRMNVVAKGYTADGDPVQFLAACSRPHDRASSRMDLRQRCSPHPIAPKALPLIGPRRRRRRSRLQVAFIFAG